MNPLTQISNELVISPYQQGIRLMRPQYNMGSSSLSIKNFINLPFNTYLYTMDNVIAKMNERTANFTGFDAIEPAIGKSIFTYMDDLSAKKIQNSNEEIFQSRNGKITQEDVVIADDSAFSGLSIKLPWYNNENKMVGILGCTIVLNFQQLAESLSLINDLNLFPASKSSICNKLDLEKLSAREKQVVDLVIEGYSSKCIGMHLGLSARTIEHYIENIKNKLNVSTKFELLKKLLQQ